jgi:hypothetical protein
MRSDSGIYENEVVDPDGNPVDLNENGIYGEDVLIIDAFGPGGYEDHGPSFNMGPSGL